MRRAALAVARRAKNDEFYTLIEDIQREMEAYLERDPDVFKGKTVLCPCDNPQYSKFTSFFTENFVKLGLKKLISTSFASANETRGRILVLTTESLGEHQWGRWRFPQR